jgi:4-hydroxy-tetrahydrodipicolinate synthase
MAPRVDWRGVFPAITTQFRADRSVDLAATGRVARALVDDGVDGIIACGSVGENTALSAAEKRAVVGAVREAADGRVPVLSGLAEITTEAATAYARDLARQGCDGLMVMPPMVYNASARELVAWFTAVAGASDLPIMLYNNPPAYRNDVTPELARQIAGIAPIVAIKESSGDTRRFVDLSNTVGDRFLLFCGLDDVVLESLALGAVGWVSGLSNVFPRECARLFALGSGGRSEEALALYRWIMPLLHLDARPDLVQCIKLCEEIAGRGSALTRPPRLVPEGAERDAIAALMRRALDNRPRI